MAWQVYYGDTLIGDPRLELPMVDKELEVSLNQTGRFEFTLLLGHPMLGKLELYQKLHEVRVVQDGEEVFRGRVMEAEESFDKSIHYTCEGDRGYLNDALLPNYEVGADAPNTYAGFFNWVISKYNDSMQENARFSVGLNQAEELGEMPAKKSEGHPKAWEELKSTVVEAGGYVRTRHEAYARIIDLLVEGDKTSSQRIRFGENLLDYSRRTGGADYCTRCCALGGTPSKGQATSSSEAGDQAKVAWLDQDADGNADWSLYKGVAVTVKFEKGNSHANPTLSVQNTGAYPVTDWDGSSPDGKDWAENETRSFWFDGSHWVMDYDSSKNSEQVTLQVLADRGLLNGYRLEDGWVVNFEAEKKYGVIEGIYENSDQMFPEQLLQEALRWLVNVKVGNTIEMTALDLHNVDPSTPPIRVGDYVRATSRPHGFDEYFICTSRKYDLDHPENDEFTLGSEYDTLTASQSRRLAELNAGINSAVDQVDIATALADSKPAIFSERPNVYKPNDLWVQASADEHGKANIMVATATSDGTFKASDWERASDYTNDDAVLRLGEVYAQYVEAADAKFENLEADTAYIKELEAESITVNDIKATTGYIADLTADNITTTTIKATTGYIGDLTSDSITTTKLKAASGYIEDLEAKSITTQDIEAAHGYIEDLESKNITTENIEAATGYIGSLTSNDITVQKLTADSAYIDALTANDVTASDLTATNAYIEDLKADNVSAQNLSAASGYIATLTSNDVTAQNLTADHGYIDTLTSNNITANDIVSDHAEIGSLYSNYAHITEGVIDNATIGHADVDGLDANYAHITNGSIDNATIDQAKVNNLSSNYAHITNGVIDNAKIGYADVNNLSAHYAEIDMANVSNAWIQNGVLNKAAVLDEQVFDLSGNKATISEINADKITVRNLNAKNLTIDTADGFVTIGDKKTPTKEYIDSLKDELQDEIDGAVETWTSTAVPLLNNYPASQWADDTARAKHVGDICYVQQQGSDYDGFCYRFSYNDGEFSWVLIKDSSVTKALKDITDLQSFESETTSWIDETEEGLRTIRQNHTALSGKVDKTVKSSVQLWYTKANTTAPTKPTAKVTSTATTGNGWRIVVPAWNASYPNYYYCWQFELADGTYAWSDVVRDIAMGESQGTSRDAQATADANIKSSVQLWFTKANSTAPAKPTSQVTTNNPATGNAWNLAVPTYSSSYPHYFYCYQQQKGDGTYQWSDVVYDKGTTEAMQKAQAALPSSTFSTFQSTTFKTLVDEVDEQSSTIETMSEAVSSNANLVNGTSSEWTELALANGTNQCITLFAGLDVTEIPNVKAGDKISVSFDIKYAVGTTRTKDSGCPALQGSCNAGGTWTSIDPNSVLHSELLAAISGADEVYRHSTYFIVTESMLNGTYSGICNANLRHDYTNGTVYVRKVMVNRGSIGLAWTPSGEDTTTLTNTVNSVKQTATSNSASITSLTKTVSDNKTSIENRASAIEQDLSGFKTTVSGTYATKTALGQETTARQTAISQLDSAIALRATKTETYQSAQPNLAPMFSSHNADGTYPDGGVGGYWQISSTKAYNRSFFTALDDGWIHVEAANNAQKEFVAARVDGLEANDRVTMLVEWRNATWTGNGASFYSRNYADNVQLTANWGPSMNTASGEARHTYVVSAADGTAAWNGLINWTFTAAASSTWTGDVRISFYKETYDSSTSSYVKYAGPYKPYSGSQLYASQAELKVANDNISSKVSTTDYTGTKVASLINQSAESVKIQAKHVEIDGTTVFKNGSTSTTVANYVGGVADNAVSNLVISGRNLATGTITHLDFTQVSTPSYFSRVGFYNTSDAGLAALADTSNELFAISFDWAATGVTTAFSLYPSLQNSSNTYTAGNNTVKSSVPTGDSSGHYSAVFEPNDGQRQYGAKWLLSRSTTTANTSGTVILSNFMFEAATKASAWSPAPEDLASATDAVEYIEGTQTAATGSWTGVTKDSALAAGKTIAYKLPYAGSGNASLQLKDSSGNNVGGNVAVYSMTTRVTTHYPAGSVIQMTYDGTYWRTAGWYNTNNYDRRLHNNYVKAAADVASGKLACGTASGYKAIAASAVFDMSYPILWAGGAWTSGTQYSNAYEAYPSVNPATTATVQGIAANKMVYVKGTISGNTFTCAASNFLTCSAPTSEDGFFYLPVGVIANDATTKMYFSSSKDLYAFLDGSFGQVNPAEIVATQKVYYRSKVSGTVPVPTAWVTATGNVYNETVSVGNSGWSTKVTPLSKDKTSNTDANKYLFLYTCEQRKRLDGTVKCVPATNALLDDTTTVIDGGSIITGSVTANQINVGSIAIGNLNGGSTVVSNATNGNTAYNRHTAYRGTCSTAAGTAAKAVTCTGFALASGATVECYCSTANTANVPTLNVNSTGAKDVWINGAVASASNPCKWKAGDTVTFTYDGTRFRASLPVENYITADSSGIKIHNASDTTNYQHQTSSGTAIYVAGNKRTETTSTGLEVFDSDGSTSLAKFGATARIGKQEKSRIEVAADNVTMAGENSVLMQVTPEEVTSGSNKAYGFRLRDASNLGILLMIPKLDGSTVNGCGVSLIGSSVTIHADDGLALNDDSASINKVMATGASSSGNGTRGVFRSLVAADIPSLAASKINSGTFDAARIPNLSAAKITSGTFGASTFSKSLRIALGSPSVERDAIAFKKGNADGDAVLVGAGGQTIVGAGESAANLYSALNSPTEEQLHLASDNSIYFHPNCQTIANRRTWELNAHLFRRHETLDNTLDNNGVTSNQYTYLSLLDKNGKYIAWFTLGGLTSGASWADMSVRKVVNGSNVNNSLALGVNKDGTRTVSVTDAAVWRTALGVPATSHNHAASNITSGTLGVARGGTGAASFTANSLVMSGSTSTSALTTLAPDDYGALYYSDDEEYVHGILPTWAGGTGKNAGTIYAATTIYAFNTTGTTGTVTLTQTAANFTFIDIFFKGNDGYYDSTRVYSPNGKVVNLSTMESTANGSLNCKWKAMTISGTSITNKYYGEMDNGGTPASVNHIYVCGVIGYK